MWISPFRDTALHPPHGKSSVFKTALGIKCSEDFNMSKQRSFPLKCYSKLCCLRPMIRHVIAFHYHVLQNDRTYIYILELSCQPIYGLSFMINWRPQLLDLSHQVSYNFLQHKKVNPDTLKIYYIYFITGHSLVYNLSIPNFKQTFEMRPQYAHVKE